MEMKILKHIYIVSLMFAAPAQSVLAQYDQDISVEGRYVPEYIARDRIGMYPRTVRPEVTQSALNYSMGGVDAEFVPHAIPAVVTGWQDARQWNRSRGYVDLGLGSWLQSTLSAGYRMIDSPASLFGVRLQHNSTSLWQPDLSGSVSRTHMQRYDERVGLYGGHDFGPGRLEASADYHAGYFNYYGFNPMPELQVKEGENINAPTQTLNDVAFRVDWMADKSKALHWHVGAGIHYFGMRRLYLPDGGDAMVPAGYTGGRETDMALRAGVLGQVSSRSSFGADMDGHVLMYADNKLSGATVQTVLKAPDTYGALALTPFYRYAYGSLNIKLGVRMDLAMNARTAAGGRYRTFNVAPDVCLDYSAGAVALELRAGGGNRLNTLVFNYETDYYTTPAIFSSKPAYSPFDGSLAVRFGPFSGFHAGAGIGYRVTFGQRYFGWYQTLLNQPAPMYAKGADYTIRGISAGVGMGYDAGRYFKIDASGTYQPQSGGKGYFNGMDRPRWTAVATLQTNPWSTLKFRLGFDFRGVRSFPLMAVEVMPDAGDAGQTRIVMHRLPHYVSLNLGVAYDVTKDIGIWLQADNLTHRRNMLAPGLPEPGVRVVAGICAQF